MSRPSRRKLAERDAVPASRLPQIVADAMPYPAAALDEQGLVVHVNAAMRERGVAPPQGPVSMAAFFPEYAAVLGPPPWDDQHSAVLSRRTAHATVRERVWIRRLPGGGCLVVGDAGPSSEREATADQTARLASLGFMVAGTCHELSNPLSAMYSMVQILRSQRGLSPELLDRGLANIQGSVSRLIEVTRKLTDFSRVGDGEKRPVGLDVVVEDALFLARQHPLAANVAFEHVRDPEAVVLGRLAELRQVAYNMLLNAMQALSGSGRITIVVSHGPNAKLSIRDDGPGIDPAHLGRILEPFFTTKASGEGTGLGLAISNEIVTEHGGTLGAENNPDRGATFHIELPLHRTRAP